MSRKTRRKDEDDNEDFFRLSGVAKYKDVSANDSEDDDIIKNLNIKGKDKNTFKESGRESAKSKEINKKNIDSDSEDDDNFFKNIKVKPKEKDKNINTILKRKEKIDTRATTQPDVDIKKILKMLEEVKDKNKILENRLGDISKDMIKHENKVDSIVGAISELRKPPLKEEHIKDLHNYNKIREMISDYIKIEEKYYFLLTGNDQDSTAIISSDDVDKTKKIVKVSSIASLFKQTTSDIIQNIIIDEENKEEEKVKSDE